MKPLRRLLSLVLVLTMLLSINTIAFAAVSDTGYSKVTSDLSIFPNLPSRVEITFEVIS